MIELAFRPDPVDDLEVDETPEFAPAAAIEHTYFVVPVRLSIDGEELLAFPGVYPDWRPLPILGFASQLRRTVVALEHGQARTITVEDGGSLSISRDGDSLVFTTSLAPIRVSASRDELITVVLNFSREACDYARSVSPAVSTHPSWSSWCPESS